MKVDNYTSVLKREEKIYTLGNVNITSTGIGVTTIKFTALGVFIGFLIGCLISLIFGKWIYWGEHSSITISVIVLGLGGCLGYYLYNGRKGPYRVYKYLIAYFTPKKIYNGLTGNTDLVYDTMKINSIVRKVL